MICRYGREIFWAGTLLLQLLLPGTQLWAAERTVTGVVEQSGFFGVTVQTSGDTGAVKYQIGRQTVFIPSHYRPLPGDTVTVRFSGEPWANGKEVRIVSALSLVKPAPARPVIASPAVGIIRKMGWKRIRFTFPANGQTLTMEMTRGTRKIPERWRPKLGDKVKVFYDRVPARFVRKTVLVIRRLEMIR
jgi:hypothetical protein